jgi:hypothetical protein
MPAPCRAPINTSARLSVFSAASASGAEVEVGMSCFNARSNCAPQGHNHSDPERIQQSALKSGRR